MAAAFYPRTFKPGSGRALLKDFARVLLLAVALPGLVIAMVDLWRGLATAREHYAARLAFAAEANGRQIDGFVQTHVAALQLLAERRSAAGDVADEAAWAADLARLRRYYPGFNMLGVVDDKGRLLLTQPAAPSARGTSVADRSYFSEPRRTGRPHVSNAYRGRLLSVPAVAVSAPFFSHGRFAGVITGTIQIEAFPVLRQQSLQTRGFQLLLVDRNHTVVHATRRLPYRSLDVLQESGRDGPLRMLESAGSRTRMRCLPGVLRDGGDAYGLMIPLQSGWRLSVLVPRSDVLAEVWRSTAVTLGLLVLVLVGVLVISGMQMRRLGEYVRDLLERMQHFALDSATAPAAPESLPQELSPLAEALNQLATRAHKAYEEVNLSLQEQSRLREELQAMARRLLTVQEDERHTLSRELHDDIGQAITAIKLGAMAVQHEPDPARSNEILAEIIAITDQTVAKLRNLSLLLRPPQLDTLGLETALRWQVEVLFRSGRPRVEMTLEPLPERPDPEVELACFRIAQEALTNILRHSKATRVTLALTPDADGRNMRLAITDDGCGFGVDQVRGLGLVTMRERAQQVGGSLQIDTSVDSGTSVRVILPMHRAVATAEQAVLSL
jgi:signal transduction histidine kinase